MYAAMPFASTGLTANLAVTAASQTVTLGTIPQGGCEARLLVRGTQDVFVRFDGTAAAVGTGMPLAPGVVEVFSFVPGNSITAIAAATGSTLYVTLGQGQ